MRLYRTVWSAGAGALTLLGMTLAVLEIPLSGLVAVVVGTGCLGALCRGGRELGAEGNPAEGKPAEGTALRRGVRAAAVTAAVGTATAGLVAAAGPSGLALALMVAAASPTAIHWVNRHAGMPEATWAGWQGGPDVDNRSAGVDAPSARSPGAAGRSASRRELPSPESLTDEQLCLAWRVTFAMVLDVGGATELALLADLRAAYLDELERRDATGFARWMASGARAGSDPGRFIGAAGNRAADGAGMSRKVSPPDGLASS